MKQDQSESESENEQIENDENQQNTIVKSQYNEAGLEQLNQSTYTDSCVNSKNKQVSKVVVETKDFEMSNYVVKVPKTL